MSKDVDIKRRKWFIKAYLELEVRGFIDPENTMLLNKFAQKFNLDGGWVFGFWSSGQVAIPEEIVYQLCKEYDFLDSTIISEDSTDYLNLTNSSKDGNIIFVPDIDFFCGDGGFNYQFKNFERFHDPSMNGTYWLFTAKGESMENQIFAGDYLYCKELKSAEYLQKGSICAIVTDDKAIIKRVASKEYSSNDEFSKLILESDNKIMFPKIIKIKSKEIKKVFKVEHVKKDIDKALNYT